MEKPGGVLSDECQASLEDLETVEVEFCCWDEIFFSQDDGDRVERGM